VGRRGGMKEIKVTLYGRRTSYAYMKENYEISCNFFKWGGEGLRGRDNEGITNNVQYKSNWNCHYESPLYNEYILIKIIKNIFILSSKYHTLKSSN
jgi:hypothetical protein